MSSAIEQRLSQLEALDAIRQLKAAYLSSCDAKDCQGFRDAFMDGPVDIDYGPIGCFDNADDLVAVFRQIACHPHMLEWHHASNPQIELLASDHARGHWSLQYQLINTQDNTLTQIGGEYVDEYRLTEAGWKISATRFAPRTTLVLALQDGQLNCPVMGSPPPVAA
ncbi:MAG: nuclear transport factor 2 family protein [Oceanococcus sp.]|nr:MAG: nuclear transport factor 2 family protein [Oceanococcus sp.]